MVYAGNWFLLSVKSGNAEIGLEKNSGHFEWFLDLEIPFLVAQVEPGDEMRVTVYQTLPHIACIKNIPENVTSIKFKCDTSPHYKPRNFQADRKDVLELKGDTAIAWLGPPILDITRASLQDGEMVDVAVNLLDQVCKFHPSVPRKGRAGLDVGVMLETNVSIEIPITTHDLVALVDSTSEVVDEIKASLTMCCQNSETASFRHVWDQTQALFELYDSVKRFQDDGSLTVQSPSLMKYQNLNGD